MELRGDDRGIIIEEHPRAVWRRILFPTLNLRAWVHAHSVEVLS